MKNFFKFSGILGLVLFLFGVLGGLVVRDFTQPLMLAHLALGLALLLAWLILGGGNLGQAGQAIRGRTARFGANAILYALVFIGIMALANWYVNRHDKRWDLTQEGAFSLSDQSAQVVKALKAPLKLVAVKGASQFVSDDALQELFTLYKYNNPAQVSTEIVDANAKPHLIDKYGFKPGNVVYIAYGEEDKAQVNRINEGSEEAVTNAIIKLTRGASKKIYYLEGHAEPKLEDDTPAGIKAFADALADENLTLEGIVLSQRSSVPEDAAAVLVVSPKKALLQSEKDMLLNYADKGGRLLLLSDTRGSSDLSELASHFGIQIGNDVILDQVQRLFAGPALGAQPIVSSYADHAITRGLKRDDVTIYNLASSVRPAAQKMQAATYTEIAKSSPSAWAETDLAAIFDAGEPTATLDSEKDLSGPVSLAVAFENKLSTQNQSAESKDDQAKFDQATRVVVFGDSDWVLNSSLGYYSNRDLALNSINWLIGEEGGISIRPRSVGMSLAPISENTFLTILASSFVVPELILLFGLFIWWRRRTVGA